MKLSEIQSGSFDLDKEIDDAASAVGNKSDVTPAVRNLIKDHVTKSKLSSMDDGQIQSLMSKASGDEKFALRVALKVVGRRDPSEQ